MPTLYGPAFLRDAMESGNFVNEHQTIEDARKVDAAMRSRPPAPSDEIKQVLAERRAADEQARAQAEADMLAAAAAPPVPMVAPDAMVDPLAPPPLDPMLGEPPPPAAPAPYVGPDGLLKLDRPPVDGSMVGG